MLWLASDSVICLLLPPEEKMLAKDVWSPEWDAEWDL